MPNWERNLLLLRCLIISGKKIYCWSDTEGSLIKNFFRVLNKGEYFLKYTLVESKVSFVYDPSWWTW